MTPADLLITGGALLPMDEGGSFFAEGAVVVAGGRIVAIGPTADLAARFTPTETIDARGKAILPGFVNCHGHAGMSLLRGLAEEMPLQRWLTATVWPLMKNAGPEDTYAGARLACLEMIRSGITCFTDMWRDMAATVQAVEESGLRARLSFNMRDFSAADRLEPEWEAGIEAVTARVPTERIAYGLSPHSLYACSETLLRRAADAVARTKCHLQIHVAETKTETEECRAQTGRSPVERLDELGLLGPSTLIAHGVWLTDDDCRRVAGAGACIAHNVSSNLKLGSGVAPLQRFARAGVTVALGTDSTASNNALDPFREMKYAALIQRAVHENPEATAPRAILAAATRHGAQALGLADQVGSLEPGKRADIILVDLEKPHLQPIVRLDAETLTALLVFAATSADVDTTIVEGRVLMRGRAVFSLDSAAVAAGANAAARRLLERAGV
jgi:5-methylthioadenosine/S-adenosylhomocysteine deaminase